MDELRSKAMTGSAWMIGMKLSVNMLGMVSTVILARLLTPEDFGLVALAGSVYVFFSLFGQLGFDVPLIQMQQTDRSHYDTAWTANIMVGCTIATIMFIVAKPAAAFYNDSRIEYVVYAFSLLSLAKGFENIGVVNFRKQLSFRGDFLYFVIPKLASMLIGVSAAFVLRSYWALVIGMVSDQFSRLVYSNLSQPFRPRFSLSRFRELFRFTKWVLGIKILRYLTFNGIEIILGRLQGPSAVGLYGKASLVAYMPSSEVAAPAKRALFPSFSTIASDTQRLRGAFVKVFAVVILISMPAAFGILAVAKPLIHVVLGEQWAASGTILTVLALVGLLDVTNNLFEPVLVARAALRPMVLVLATHAAVLVVSSIFLINHFGTIGAAYAMLLSAVAAMPLYIFAARSEIGFTMSELGRHLWRPLLSSLVMVAAVKLAEGFAVAPSGATPVALVLLIATGIVTYCTALLALWWISGRPDFPELTLLQSVATKFKRRTDANRHTKPPDAPRGSA